MLVENNTNIEINNTERKHRQSKKIDTGMQINYEQTESKMLIKDSYKVPFH